MIFNLSSLHLYSYTKIYQQSDLVKELKSLLKVDLKNNMLIFIPYVLFDHLIHS